MHNGQPQWGRRGIRTQRYTLIISKMPNKPIETVLRDNANDPYQLHNIAEENPQLVSELTIELKKWLKKNQDPWLSSEQES